LWTGAHDLAAEMLAGWPASRPWTAGGVGGTGATSTAQMLSALSLLGMTA